MNESKELIVLVKQHIDTLINYCNKEGWKGYDPYDGLASPVFNFLFISKDKYFRTLVIQFFKNFPINLRPMFFIKKEINAKALALFLKGIIIIYRHFNNNKYLGFIDDLANLLVKETNYNNLRLWGYCFDWQSRSFFVKKYTPNLVVSYFVLDSLLELYYLTGKKYFKEVFVESCYSIMDNFIVEKVNESYFKYVPNNDDLIHNVNLFGSSLMAKAFRLTNEEKFLSISEETLKTTIKHQRSDGSWFYGREGKHHWIDSFHTCYNLLSLKEFMINTGRRTYEDNLINGLNYYVNNFLTNDYVVKYFNNKIYPIDIHCLTVGIITLIELNEYLKNKEIFINIYKFLAKNFRNKDGFFYFRKYKLYKNKISYIRWNQAWSLLCLAKLYDYLSDREG